MPLSDATTVNIVSVEKEPPRVHNAAYKTFPRTPPTLASSTVDDESTDVPTPHALQKEFQLPLDQIATSNDLAASEVQRRQQAFTMALMPGLAQQRGSHHPNEMGDKSCQGYLSTTEEVLYSSTLLRGRCFSFFKYMVAMDRRCQG